jgi:Zn-dependent peptidase ImmA (M78 family)
VYETELPGDLLGCVDIDRRIIWLDSRLTEAERRSTLAHEIGHLERGLPCDHGESNASDVTERAIDQWAARQLIDIRALASAFQWSSHLAEIAEELWIDEHLLRERLRCLTDEEQDILMQALSRARWIAVAV